MPAGWPLAASVTGLTKPPDDPTLTEYWALSPGQISALPGVALRLKSATASQDWTRTSSMYQPSRLTEVSLPSRKRKRAVWPA